MFNPLAPAQLVTALSTVLREAADWQRPLEPFQVGQLLSASSIGRYLAAELGGGAQAWQDFRGKLATVVADEAGRAAAEDGEWARAITDAAERIPGLDSQQQLGNYLAELLELGRDHQAATFPRFRRDLQQLFGELVNAEVAILAGEKA